MTIQQADSTVVQQPQAVEEVGTTSPVQTEVRPAKPRYPYQVLRQLPANATPAQQDSAIQAHAPIPFISLVSAKARTTVM